MCPSVNPVSFRLGSSSTLIWGRQPTSFFFSANILKFNYVLLKFINYFFHKKNIQLVDFIINQANLRFTLMLVIYKVRLFARRYALASYKTFSIFRFRKDSSSIKTRQLRKKIVMAHSFLKPSYDFIYYSAGLRRRRKFLGKRYSKFSDQFTINRFRLKTRKRLSTSSFGQFAEHNFKTARYRRHIKLNTKAPQQANKNCISVGLSYFFGFRSKATATHRFYKNQALFYFLKRASRLRAYWPGKKKLKLRIKNTRTFLRLSLKSKNKSSQPTAAEIFNARALSGVYVQKLQLLKTLLLSQQFNIFSHIQVKGCLTNFSELLAVLPHYTTPYINSSTAIRAGKSCLVGRTLGSNNSTHIQNLSYNYAYSKSQLQSLLPANTLGSMTKESSLFSCFKNNLTNQRLLLKHTYRHEDHNILYSKFYIFKTSFGFLKRKIFLSKLLSLSRRGTKTVYAEWKPSLLVRGYNRVSDFIRYKKKIKDFNWTASVLKAAERNKLEKNTKIKFTYTKVSKDSSLRLQKLKELFVAKASTDRVITTDELLGLKERQNVAFTGKRLINLDSPVIQYYRNFNYFSFFDIKTYNMLFSNIVEHKLTKRAKPFNYYNHAYKSTLLNNNLFLTSSSIPAAEEETCTGGLTVDSKSIPLLSYKNLKQLSPFWYTNNKAKQRLLLRKKFSKQMFLKLLSVRFSQNKVFLPSMSSLVNSWGLTKKLGFRFRKKKFFFFNRIRTISQQLFFLKSKLPVNRTRSKLNMSTRLAKFFLLTNGYRKSLRFLKPEWAAQKNINLSFNGSSTIKVVSSRQKLNRFYNFFVVGPTNLRKKTVGLTKKNNFFFKKKSSRFFSKRFLLQQQRRYKYRDQSYKKTIKKLMSLFKKNLPVIPRTISSVFFFLYKFWVNHRFSSRYFIKKKKIWPPYVPLRSRRRWAHKRNICHIALRSLRFSSFLKKIFFIEFGRLYKKNKRHNVQILIKKKLLSFYYRFTRFKNFSGVGLSARLKKNIQPVVSYKSVTLRRRKSVNAKKRIKTISRNNTRRSSGRIGTSLRKKHISMRSPQILNARNKVLSYMHKKNTIIVPSAFKYWSSWVYKKVDGISPDRTPYAQLNRSYPEISKFISRQLVSERRRRRFEKKRSKRRGVASWRKNSTITPNFITNTAIKYKFKFVYKGSRQARKFLLYSRVYKAAYTPGASPILNTKVFRNNYFSFLKKNNVAKKIVYSALVEDKTNIIPNINSTVVPAVVGVSKAVIFKKGKASAGNKVTSSGRVINRTQSTLRRRLYTLRSVTQKQSSSGVKSFNCPKLQNKESIYYDNFSWFCIDNNLQTVPNLYLLDASNFSLGITTFLETPNKSDTSILGSSIFSFSKIFSSIMISTVGNKNKITRIATRVIKKIRFFFRNRTRSGLKKNKRTFFSWKLTNLNWFLKKQEILFLEFFFNHIFGVAFKIAIFWAYNLLTYAEKIGSFLGKRSVFKQAHIPRRAQVFCKNFINLLRYSIKFYTLNSISSYFSKEFYSRARQRIFLITIEKILRYMNFVSLNFSGVSLLISGKLSRQPRAKKSFLIKGLRPSLNRFDLKVNYVFRTVRCPFGSYGVKMWLYYF